MSFLRSYIDYNLRPAKQVPEGDGVYDPQPDQQARFPHETLQEGNKGIGSRRPPSFDRSISEHHGDESSASGFQTEQPASQSKAFQDAERQLPDVQVPMEAPDTWDDHCRQPMPGDCSMTSFPKSDVPADDSGATVDQEGLEPSAESIHSQPFPVHDFRTTSNRSHQPGADGGRAYEGFGKIAHYNLDEGTSQPGQPHRTDTYADNVDKARKKESGKGDPAPVQMEGQGASKKPFIHEKTSVRAKSIGAVPDAKVTPQVRIGHINVLVEDRASVKHRPSSGRRVAGASNTFGLKGL